MILSTNTRVDGALAIRTVRDLEEIASIREVWRSFQDHPWSDVDYYTTFLARQPEFVRPHVMLVERDRRPVALVAASLLDDTLPWRVGSLTVGRSRARVLRVGGGGVMGESSEEVARAITGELVAALARGEAAAAYVHQLDSASPLCASLRHVSALARDRAVRAVGGWVLELPDSYAAYLDSRTRGVRRHVKRYSGALERKLGADLAIACYREPAELERLVRDSESVARLTYHRGMGVGFEDTDSERRLLAHAMDAGWLRGYVLYAQQRPIAFWHMLVYGRTVYTGVTGYDPAFGALRPGQYLLSRIIAEHCGSRAVERFDYGVMELDYKRQLGTRRYERCSIYVFSRRPRGLYLSTLRTASGASDRSARWLLGSRARQWARKLASMRLRRPSGENRAADDDGEAQPSGDEPTS